ncbi:ABC transporter substrate-binding protein [Cognatiyoonia sp. IB215182]|uniref:ABC transporter substrate-binding protein n=1 Tax=Cognatiyoonia sp. IB215182 TaxID=3097353 RepID=UPI002A0DD02E|nr:ABC transporter substrate-binding protein [Cognatiyoonia sp. IB215182]MDX8354786.1 ABC transporter substrate-binding protein [Cognatiyoonia sp. IB215182]
MKLRLTLASLLTLAAAPAAALDCNAGFRAFTHHLGETCIPEQPQRIASLRGDSVTTPLLDIGAPIALTVMNRMEDGTTYIRGAADIFGEAFIAESGVAYFSDRNPVDIEALAAAGPDLIIGRIWNEEILGQLEAIAPTVIIPPQMPYLDHLAWLADVSGSQQTFDTELARYQDRIADAKATIGDPSAITVSRFDVWEDGLWYYPNWGAIDQVINDIGFAKPAIQAEATEGMNGVSVERMQEFDGDVLIASRAPRFGQTIPMLTEQWDQVAPFWRELGGVKSGNLYWYERDILVGYTFDSLDRSIDFLTAITAGRDFN